MHLQLGRPDLAQYADRSEVPAAHGDFAVTFLGVSTLLLDDGASAVMTDGFFSRPELGKVAFGSCAGPCPDRPGFGADRHQSAGEDLHIRIVARHTGELLRELTLDPNRDFQPRGVPPGPPRKNP